MHRVRAASTEEVDDCLRAKVRSPMQAVRDHMGRARLFAGLLSVLLQACGAASAPTASPAAAQPGGPLFPPAPGAPGTLVITGVDANHVVTTAPLVQVTPAPHADDAEVRVTVVRKASTTMLIEGGVDFIRAHTSDGGVILDRILHEPVDTIALPPGDYVLEAYYRSCDANCGLLDPEKEYCTSEETLEAEGRYRLEITVQNLVGDCSFGPSP